MMLLPKTDDNDLIRESVHLNTAAQYSPKTDLLCQQLLVLADRSVDSRGSS